MYFLGTFVANNSTDQTYLDDLDFFTFPALDDKIGADAIDAPIDGFMMAAKPKNEDGAKAGAAAMGGPKTIDAYLAISAASVAANSKADTANYNKIQTKSAELIGNAKNIAQFLDRDTSPDFVSNVIGDAFANFVADPTQVDSILSTSKSRSRPISADIISADSAGPRRSSMTADVTTTVPPARGRRRRYSKLSRSDKRCVWMFDGRRALGHPHHRSCGYRRVSTIFLSFTTWDGIRLGTWQLVGFRNYWSIFTVFDGKFFPALFNNMILLVCLSICSADRHAARLPARQEHPRLAHLPEHLLLPGRAFVWPSSGSSGRASCTRRAGPVQRRARPTARQPDRLARQRREVLLVPCPVPRHATRSHEELRRVLIAMAWRHIGYVMVLYLAGLEERRSDAARSRARSMAATSGRRFRRVVFPVMKPINVIVLVITVIEALRAFDIIFALKEPPGHDSSRHRS